MNISGNWLSEYIDYSYSPEELDAKLTSLGIEVESIEDPSKRFNKIVVGKVLEAIPHPNADKLRLTQVTIGGAEPLKIVCGAPNVREGMMVAVAQIGADLGEGFVIKKSKIRGETSEGMLCSAKELGLSDDHSGLIELPASSVIGQPLAEALGGTDIIYEIGITPNRADCLSHIGIAREVAIANGNPVRRPAINTQFLNTAADKTSSAVKVTIEAPDLCPRYAARVVRGIKVAESPEWLKKRLEAVGLRPRNTIVDITNFVLMECGHPLHAFDLGTVANNHIIVRRAEGFASSFVTLDSKERKLDPDTLLISDKDKPLAIAGIMGGENSEITDQTTTVLIESAYFNPSSIRRSAKRLGLSTDASYRFERGVDMENVIFAVDRAAALMAELAGGEVLTDIVDEYTKAVAPATFSFRPSRANALLGTSLDTATISTTLKRVGFSIHSDTPERLSLTAPSWRVDLLQEVDAIEEIARVIGYDALPTSIEDRIPINRERDVLSKGEFDQLLRLELIALGFYECVSTPMLPAKAAARFQQHPVEVMNPLTIELERMRTSIVPNLLDICRRNERFGANGQRLFESGSVFKYEQNPRLVANIEEHGELAVLIKDNLDEKNAYNTKEQRADLFFLRAVMEQLCTRLGIPGLTVTPLSESKSLGEWSLAPTYLDPNEAISFYHKRELLGVAGKITDGLAKEYELRSAPYIVSCSYDQLHQLAAASRMSDRATKALPKYPAVERDIAFIVDRPITARTLMDTAKNSIPAELLEEVRIFDSFESKELKAAGKKSLGIRFSLRSQERTLEDAEVDSVMASVIATVTSTTGATLRT